MKWIFSRTALVAVVMLLLGFVTGWVSATRIDGQIPISSSLTAWLGPGAALNRTTPDELRPKFAVFWEVWNLVENEWYTRDPIDRDKMIRGAIQGMLAALEDDYTVYQEPELAAQTNEHMQGKQAGIGTYLRITDGRAFLWKPIKNAPAVQAGLKQDDEILKVDGEDIPALIAGLDINEASVKVAGKIRGPEGTQVQLSIRREAENRTFDLTITRADVIIPSVESQIIDGNLAYIRISEFKSNTTSEFDEALRVLLPQKPVGIVLDLRNNPGGFLQNAQDVLGRFSDGVALVEENRRGETKTLNANVPSADLRVYDLPVVVLVNQGSASASEIVAGAIRDNRQNAFLLGERTYGKGSVQSIHQLSDGGSARVTFAHWFTPKMGEIHNVGITPEFLVPYNEDEPMQAPCVADRQPPQGRTFCADSQLFWAMKMLTTGERPPVVAASQ